MTNQSWVNITEEERLETLKAISHRELERLIPSIVILSIFSLTGTVGNSISVYVFASRMKRNFQNNLFIYLCIMNIVACAVCVPGDIMDLAFAFNYPSSEICKATRFFNMFTIAGYVLTLGTISVYRLRAASVASLTTSVKTTSIRGVVGIFIASLGMAWLGAVVYGVRYTPTGVQGVKGQDCSIAEDVANTAWPAGFYSFLGIGFTTLVLTVGISYYRIWQIVKRSKTTVAAHTTINVVSPVAAGLAVVTGPQERQGRISPALEGGEPLKQDVVSGMYDLMPSASAMYQEASFDFCMEKEGSDLSTSFAPNLNGNTQITCLPKHNIKHITKTDVCGVTSTFVLDDRDDVVVKDKLYERFQSNSLKTNKFPINTKTPNIRRNKQPRCQQQHSRSNPDLATIKADEQISALFRSLSVVELSHRASLGVATRVEPQNCSWLDLKRDSLHTSSKYTTYQEGEVQDRESTLLLEKRKKRVKSSLRNTPQPTSTAKKKDLDLAPSETDKNKVNSVEKTSFSNAVTADLAVCSSNITGVGTLQDKDQADKTLHGAQFQRQLTVAPSSPKDQSLIPIQATARTKNSKTALENAITRTAFLLTFTFIASYLPFFVVSIPHFIIPDFDYTQNTGTLNVINMAYRLYFINPTISPFIFWASNLDFRRGIKSLCNID